MNKQEPSIQLASTELADKDDNRVLPFTIESLDVRGRVVRLGSTLDAILAAHAYPEPVSRLLAEATALTALLGTALKFDGRLILQAQSDGAVSMLVVEFTAPDSLRAYARFNQEAFPETGHFDSGALLGHGHLAMTIDQGAEMERYQGIVALDGSNLEEIAHRYFVQSEQIPTRVRLASAQLMRPQNEDISKTVPQSVWRAGSVLVQSFPSDDNQQSHLPDELSFNDNDKNSNKKEDNAWAEAEMRMATIQDSELTDPQISSEQLLLRLFNEHDVRIFDPLPVINKCQCSREKIDAILRGFSTEEQQDMVVNGHIIVTCEYCGHEYVFEADSFT